MVNNKKHMALIGFSGSGKSTVGPALAKKLRYNYIDLDEQIENKYQLSIADIFAENGEQFFRVAETKLLSEILKKRKNTVIALGGGAFQKPANRKLLEQNSLIVYLSCSQKELYKRLKAKSDRPLLPKADSALKPKIKSLLGRRIKNYKKADITISTTDNTIRESVTLIIKRIKNANG